jgi:poly(3-hydroxybutyrate) depolymerase
VALHGCEQSISLIDNSFALHAGYNEWAEENLIVVLYPYVETSAQNPLNPDGFDLISFSFFLIFFFVIIYLFLTRNIFNVFCFVCFYRCWDWWGYTNSFYGVKTGVQMKFIRSLISALGGF